MATLESSARVAVMAVCLDPASYQALSHFMAGVPGAVIIGNLDHYAGVEREVGRALHLPHIGICFIDYDQDTEEALWITERLRSEYPDLHTFAVSSYSEPEGIIAAMRAGCVEYLS
ncbi:MAG TPA: response regulator, partial [Terriglobales bacterium]|nr:response regulator [Terriglobales bacterium]